MTEQTQQPLNYRLYTYKKNRTNSVLRRRYDEQLEGSRTALEAYKATGLATADVVAKIEAEIARLERERAAL